MKMKLAAIVLLLLSAAGGFWLYQYKKNQPVVIGANSDKYGVFVGEIYDKIQQNYWDKISDGELSNLFLLATEKITNNKLVLKSQDKAGVGEIVQETIATMSADKKTEFLANMADVVLANLKPFGRSRLYSEKMAQDLTNTVNNVNPTVNQFQVLGVPTGVSDKEVAQAFQTKEKELAPAAKESTAAAQKLAEVKQAYQVLKTEDSRQVYQISGAEPTIDYKLLTPTIYYIHMTKFSPTSLDEFARVAAKVDNKGAELNTLILDLRDNIGGAIDSLPYFLGPFIGPNTYAYQFYHQGNYEDFKTQTGWMNSLVRYKKVVILINGGTQSTAEVMAAVLKKYNVGVVVGTTTKGWGPVEKVYPMDSQIDSSEKFSLFIVNHVTLRDDNQPIEGRGVDPMINTGSAGWQKELLARFGDTGLVTAVEGIIKGN
jgi:carboxyl-terminal processing protease